MLRTICKKSYRHPAFIIMRKLKVSIVNQSAEIIKELLCEHLDATPQHTCLHNLINETTNKIVQSMFCIPGTIDHFNIVDGVASVYYTSGISIEVRRV